MTASPGSALILVENLSVPFDRRVWQEARSLRRAGYEVHVVCPQGRTQDTEPHVVVDEIEIHRYPLEAATGGAAGYVREYAAAFRHTARLVRRVTRRTRVDVVHACNPPDLLFLAAAPLRRGGTAFIFDQHDLVPELYVSRFGRRGLGYRLTLLAERLTFRLADVVVSTNESYRRVALERGGKHPEDVFVVRSAPDRGRFPPADPDPALRRGRRHLLAYLGVMGPQDGVDHALRALAELRARRDDWHAVFVGDGDARPAMERLASSLGLASSVEFTGRLPDPDVARVLTSAEVCLAPDPKSPLNDVSTMNKILEYMALGKPVVSYDLTEARVSAGDAAAYAVPDDVASFAARIAELLDDPDRRTRMGETGKARVDGPLSWQHSERELLAAYERALAKRRAFGPRQ